MRVLLEVDGGYVEVIGDGRLRAAVRECRGDTTQRSRTVIDALGSDAIAAAADALGERFAGIARPAEVPQRVEPRPEPAGEPRIVFGDGADRCTFMKLVEHIGEGWVIGITDSAGKTVDVELSHTTAEAVVGWRFDAEAGEPTTEQVRVPVEQVVEVKVW